MAFLPGDSPWWGAPKKFSRNIAERRVSWQELFFDLVYVIAVSKITHMLAHHFDVGHLLKYVVLFCLIFWGWLNGSLYHDLHGGRGLRTRLMTLWQMMIIAALAITLDQDNETPSQTTIIVFMIMQLYITYMWWSVGFYDREHRRYNLPYTILYLLSLGLMSLALWTPEKIIPYIIPLIILFNYAPPFISSYLMRNRPVSLDLSSSMFERLGLFTIIVFGEVVLGVVDGVNAGIDERRVGWFDFALAVSIVFAMWWLFFTFLSNREVKKGFVNASLLELSYIPSLIALGVTAVSFSGLFHPDEHAQLYHRLLCGSIALFLFFVSVSMGFVQYPETLIDMNRKVRIALPITAAVFLILVLVPLQLPVTGFLVVVLMILVLLIAILNYNYYRLGLEHEQDSGPQ